MTAHGSLGQRGPEADVTPHEAWSGEQKLEGRASGAPDGSGAP
jgi:hypothetical protein